MADSGNKKTEKLSGAKREKYICDFVTHMVKVSGEETSPDRHRFQRNLGMFQGKMDWGITRDENPWMSKIFMHDFAAIIRRAANAAQNIIFQREEFVHLTSGEADRQFTEIQEKILRYFLKDIGFRRRFYEYLLVGGIFGITGWKITVEKKKVFKPEIILKDIEKTPEALKEEAQFNAISDEEAELGLAEELSELFGPPIIYSSPQIGPKEMEEVGFRLDLVNPLNIYYDPDVDDINRSSWIAEEMVKRFHELEPFFKSGVLDKSKKSQILKLGDKLDGNRNFGITGYAGYKGNVKSQFTQPNKYDPRIRIVEYFGPLLSEDGEILEENMHFIVANDEVLIKQSKNPYFRQRPPYLFAVFNKQPFKAVGAGLADGAVDQNILTNDLVSMMVDLIRKEVHGVMAVSQDKVVDLSQIENGIAPGSIIQMFGTDDVKKAIAPVPLGVGNNTFQVLQVAEALRLSGEKGAGVDTQTANPASRSRITAAEVSLNANKGNESINVLAHTLDEECIIPVVYTIKDLAMQFGFGRGTLTELFAKGVLTQVEYDLVANISMLERFNETKRRIIVEVRGFRYAYEKDAFLARTAEFIHTINTMPQEAQQRIDWKSVITDMAEAYGFEGDKWIIQNTPGDKAREENRLLANGNLVMVLPTDDHLAELPEHYQQMLLTPSDVVAQHIQMHVEAAVQQGLEVPPPPPEVADLLGYLPLPGQEEPMGEVMQ